MKFENTEVWGFEHAIRGMRNPLESWNKSDSHYDIEEVMVDEEVVLERGKYIIGSNDLQLAQTLIRAGSEHRKFLRQIFVAVDITAPLYFFKELDTYKVGTVSNSTSTMHKLASTPITIDCFEMGDFTPLIDNFKIDLSWQTIVTYLEQLRQRYNETKDKRYWKELIRLLPESWLQKRTITMNYENILNMYRQRKNHKLTEWSKSFCDWVKTLPYAEELICLRSKL